MKRHSKKRAAKERRLRKIEARLIAEGNTRCFFYPYQSGSCYDHIIPKSHSEELIDCEDNLVPVSNRAHYILTFGTNEQIRKLPNISRYLEKMKNLDETYYKRFITNHELT